MRGGPVFLARIKYAVCAGLMRGGPARIATPSYCLSSRGNRGLMCIANLKKKVLFDPIAA